MLICAGNFHEGVHDDDPTSISMWMSSMMTPKITWSWVLNRATIAEPLNSSAEAFHFDRDDRSLVSKLAHIYCTTHPLYIKKGFDYAAALKSEIYLLIVKIKKIQAELLVQQRGLKS